MKSDVLQAAGFIISVVVISMVYYIVIDYSLDKCQKEIEQDTDVGALSELYNTSVSLAEQNWMLQNELDQARLELARIKKGNASEIMSPISRVDRKDVQFYEDRILLYVEEAFPVEFEPTGSMEPLINENVLALETRPENESDLKTGDIIGYQSKLFNTTIVHRIIEVNTDEHGWYAIAKGDANPAPDQERVRFADIEGVIVGLIY